MEQALANVSTAFDGESVPLAHGLFLATRLILDDSLGINGANGPSPGTSLAPPSNELVSNAFKSCMNAIRMSLAVVAEDVSSNGTDCDLHRGYAHADFESSHQLVNANNVTLNVNGGCLGANTSFGGLAMSQEETKRRKGIQRIVVGSWLLSKEACGCLAAICCIDTSFIADAGNMLLDTLTTLKHQGAAFAAASALERVSSRCFEKISSQLPMLWMNRLVSEITQKSTVHQSTLRRSSGYAFAFLAIMKAERKTTKSASRLPLSSETIRTLIEWSSPSASQMQAHLERLKLTDKADDFSSYMGAVSDIKYDWKCRVHSMNILRLLLLDSTLSDQLTPFVGDALIISLLGFGDGSWAVSNSATMVFAAAMLRIDADKNSTAAERMSCLPTTPASSLKSDVGSGKGGAGKANKSGSAMTAHELFLTYPILSPFLLAELGASIADESTSATTTLYR